MLLRALTPLFAMGCLSSGEGKPFGSDSGAPILEDPNPTDDSGEPTDTGSMTWSTRPRRGLADGHGLSPHCAHGDCGGQRRQPSRRHGGLRRLGGLCDCPTGGRRVHGDHLYL